MPPRGSAALTFAQELRSDLHLCTAIAPVPSSRHLAMNPPNPPLANRTTDQPINSATLPLWALCLLPVTWFLTFRLLLAHDPLAKAIALGADFAKQQALGVIPADWRDWLAQPVVQLIHQYATPYAVGGKALMATWGLTLGVIIPAAVAVLAFLVLHLGLRLTGGAPGGWRATARSVFGIFACADLAVLAWSWLMITQGGDFLTRTLGLAGGLIAIRVISLAWLLIDLTRRHQLGALRVSLLGLPTLFFAFAVSALFAFAHWLWFTAGFALEVLR